ncbi:aminoacyl-tRNA hydrolase [Pyruvatibacter sp.]|uniref:aminoacyl-tRNA hydrolase n=1 Tax=Pyruvatibacter sp. TaxID=1981328 RepID=UPI0032EB3C05
MLLIAGLGNPGPKYENHRHNIGFMAVDAIARDHGFGPWRAGFQGAVSEGRLGTEKVLLLKPQTYMNDSGISVSQAANFYKLGPNDVYVIYDEIDLAPMKVRVKAGGGAAGHNGIRSIAAHFGKDFMRVRLGVGHPGDKNKVPGYVLKDFAKAERPWVEAVIEAVSDAVVHLAQQRDSEFMNKVALYLQDRGFGTKPTKQESGFGQKPQQPAKPKDDGENA